MGNWKQVQARIRKARIGADAPVKLEQLFQKTRDGMVAFELARVHEAGQRLSDALEWYRTAHARFRREEWRTKAAEAITRLGGTLPEPSASRGAGLVTEQPAASAEEGTAPASRWDNGLPERLYHQPDATRETIASPEAADTTALGGAEAGGESVPPAAETAGEAATPLERAPGGRRRRGRRGGRRHRKGRAAHQPAAAATPTPRVGHVPDATPPATEPPARVAPAAPRTESPAESGWVGAHAETLRTRAGDPGLASRVARLEMQVRRLLACPPHRVGESEKAPAGPGVLLLSDSDLTTHYYISACDTLRIEISRLARSERGTRGRGRGWESEGALRSRLAEHLEISESQVAKYLEAHCVVRWLQLDEGARRVAHFAIGVLEPLLNE